MKGNKKIDVQAAVDKLNSSDLSEISEAVKNGDFSNEEIESIQNDVDGLLLVACKTKLSLELRFLYEEEPDLALRDVVVKMLISLPSDLDPEFLPFLTDFVLKTWKLKMRNLAA